MPDWVKDIILAVVTSSAVSSFAQFILTKIDNKKNLAKKIDELDNKFERKNALDARAHILHFADEQRSGLIQHSEDYFRQQILDIDTYNRYCETHPEFANGLTKMASEYIQNEYKRIYLTNDD